MKIGPVWCKLPEKFPHYEGPAFEPVLHAKLYQLRNLCFDNLGRCKEMKRFNGFVV